LVSEQLTTSNGMIILVRQNRSQLQIGTSVFAVYRQQESCEGRLSSTVLWERGGEILKIDPISGDFGNNTKTKSETNCLKNKRTSRTPF